jgi:hypothetical protein
VLSHAWIVSCLITYFICIICVCFLFIWSNLLLWSYLLFMWSYAFVILFAFYVILCFCDFICFCDLICFLYALTCFLYTHIFDYLCLTVFNLVMFPCIYVIVGFKSFV